MNTVKRIPHLKMKPVFVFKSKALHHGKAAKSETINTATTVATTSLICTN